jgi:hypothetical protein
MLIVQLHEAIRTLPLCRDARTRTFPDCIPPHENKTTTAVGVVIQVVVPALWRADGTGQTMVYYGTDGCKKLQNGTEECRVTAIQEASQ